MAHVLEMSSDRRHGPDVARVGHGTDKNMTQATPPNHRLTVVTGVKNTSGLHLFPNATAAFVYAKAVSKFCLIPLSTQYEDGGDFEQMNQ